MIEDFYLSLTLDYFYRWIILNQKQYREDHVTCFLQEQDKYGRYVTYKYDKVYGNINIYDSGIIEEQIFSNETNDLLFYLHYKLNNMTQMTRLFKEFYKALLSQSLLPPTKILLCCSGGLTTSLFAEKLNQLCELEKLNYQIDAIGVHQLMQKYQDYKYLYLAPQVAYLQPKIISRTMRQIHVSCIDPTVYATSDYQKILDKIVEDTKKD